MSAHFRAAQHHAEKAWNTAESELRSASHHIMCFLKMMESIDCKEIQGENAVQALHKVSNYLREAGNLVNSFAKKSVGTNDLEVSEFQFQLFDDLSPCDEMQGLGTLPSDEEMDQIIPALPYNNAQWDDIIGLHSAKAILKEAMVWPVSFPRAFGKEVGQRRPWNGILLYGPPGTAKTHLACAAASECGAYFITISISDIMCKYVGESEKAIRRHFDLAKQREPSLIFIDQVDSIMGKRSDQSSEASLRAKATLLIQMTEVSNNHNVFIMGATNMPELLDSAFLCRFEIKVYTELPKAKDRRDIFKLCLRGITHTLTEKDFEKLGYLSKRFSGADIKKIVKDAHYMPLRRCRTENCQNPDFESAIAMEDLTKSLAKFEPCTKAAELRKYERMARAFGSMGISETE